MLTHSTNYKFHVNEYLTIFDLPSDSFSKTAKTELINGQVFDLPPRHFKLAKTQRLLREFLIKALNTPEVYETGSIIMDEFNMLEPDIFVLKPNSIITDNYPKAQQLQLVVEVADSTYKTDIINNGTGKLAIYANAGIESAWVVDVENGIIHEFSQPKTNLYQQCIVHKGKTNLLGKPVNVGALIG